MWTSQQRVIAIVSSPPRKGSGRKHLNQAALQQLGTPVGPWLILGEFGNSQRNKGRASIRRKPSNQHSKTHPRTLFAAAPTDLAPPADMATGEVLVNRRDLPVVDLTSTDSAPRSSREQSKGADDDHAPSSHADSDDGIDSVSLYEELLDEVEPFELSGGMSSAPLASPVG